MANTKTAKKECRKNVVRRAHNKSIMTRKRTYEKRAAVAAVSGSVEDALVALRLYESVAMKAAKTNICSRRSVARRVSRMNLALNARKSGSANA